jgi:hypothetical protein
VISFGVQQEIQKYKSQIYPTRLSNTTDFAQLTLLKQVRPSLTIPKNYRNGKNKTKAKN